MPNPYRGEIEAEIGGARRKLVLTLGALAELEAAFGADDLVALAERFGTGKLAARDLARIIGAGLRGAGEAVTDDEVARMAVPDGAAGYADPLPQALVLTAIVITLGTTAFAVSLALSLFSASGTDHVDGDLGLRRGDDAERR